MQNGNTSALRQQAAHTTYKLSSPTPSCSTRAIQKSLTLNEKYTGFQARSSDLRGRWSWTLKFAQKRSWVGRWSWAEQVGCLELSKLFVNSSATDIVLMTLSSTAVETAIAQCTSRWAMTRGHRLNTSIVMAAVHGLSGRFHTVSAVEHSLSRHLPTLSLSLILTPFRLRGHKATWKQRNKRYLSFLEKSQENGPSAEKWQDRKSKRTRQKKTREETGKGGIKWRPWDSRQEVDISLIRHPWPPFGVLRVGYLCAYNDIYLTVNTSITENSFTGSMLHW